MTEKEKNEFCAYLLKEFDLKLDASNELLAVYYSLHEAKLNLKQISEEISLTLQKSLASIQTKQYRFEYAGAVKEWWQGKTFYLIAIVILASVISGICYLIYDTHKEKEAPNPLYEYISHIPIMKNDRGETYFIVPNKHEQYSFKGGYEIVKPDAKTTALKIYFSGKLKE